MKIYQLYMVGTSTFRGTRETLHSDRVFTSRKRAEAYWPMFKEEWAKHIEIYEEEVIELDLDSTGDA